MTTKPLHANLNYCQVCGVWLGMDDYDGICTNCDKDEDEADMTTKPQAQVWEPLLPGQELRLWQGIRHRQSNCYIISRDVVAGRLLPNGYAVCRLAQPDAGTVPLVPMPAETVAAIAYARGLLAHEVREFKDATGREPRYLKALDELLDSLTGAGVEDET